MKIKKGYIEEYTKVANELHEMLCNSNHTDGCSWCYETWENPGHARTKYYEVVLDIVTKNGIERAHDIAALIRVGKRMEKKVRKMLLSS